MLLRTIVMILMTVSTAHAEMELLETIAKWDIYKNHNSDGTTVCQAVSYPYRTRAFTGIRAQPWAAITMIGRGAYTFSGYNGISTDKEKGIIFKSDNGYPATLDVVDRIIKTDDRSQDDNILNALMRSDGYFTIRSFGVDDDISVDYYYTEGLWRVLQYMNRRCL